MKICLCVTIIATPVTCALMCAHWSTESRRRSMYSTHIIPRRVCCYSQRQSLSYLAPHWNPTPTYSSGEPLEYNACAWRPPQRRPSPPACVAGPATARQVAISSRPPRRALYSRPRERCIRRRAIYTHAWSLCASRPTKRVLRDAVDCLELCAICRTDWAAQRSPCALFTV
ncbi:hypothetical protein HYPSUDRAFT_1054830 [Hypholoma sublateritium FD-334 SS-4]|uniref:Secreted protein n=1 Tax=Hypholoma sublateritium (strain FD-334 SS-4) TaxID=945553 RepID=A0A0D2KQE1_HYPSF|nr:hypothetical protein HYPSUDRAFT_1054830 [Hypholoma sublateritium FD-334 SS-4]